MTDAMRVSKSLEIPIEYVTQTGGLLAVRGAGKSNAARVIAEEMYAAGLPFCAIDPVGSWYGLRAGRDGTPNGGLPVFIFGGAHGDVQINSGAGALVADVIVEQRLTCIVDLSKFEDDREKKKFLLAFLKRLYFQNKDPLHLFLEEADDYFPQDMSEADRPLVRAGEDLIRRGRSRGLGATIITQRSAAINKKVFTQVENLFVLRTTGPQDVKAISEWVKYHEVKEELLESLAALDDGEAWVWSPHFLKTTKKFRFRMSSTFDSGATPKNFKAKAGRKIATLHDVNVSWLNERIELTQEKVAGEDPAQLRSRIAKLQAELHSATALTEKLQKAKGQSMDQRKANQLVGMLTNLVSGIADVQTDAQTALEELTSLLTPNDEATATQQSHRLPTTVQQPRVAKSSTPSGAQGLQKTPRALLQVLSARHPKPSTYSMLAILSGYSKNSSGFANGLSTLRTAGYATGSIAGMVATEAGLAANGPPERYGTGDELLTTWMGKLNKTPRDLLQALSEAYPKALSKEDLALAADKSITSSGFANGISELYVLELITKPEKNMLRLSDDFYG